MERELPIRKRLRLEGHDYSNSGYYFCTICVDDGHQLLGKIACDTVGDAVLCVPPTTDVLTDIPTIELSDIGQIVKTYLDKMNTIIQYAYLEKYVIMPNHVHLLITLKNGTQNDMQNGTQNGTQRTAYPTKYPTTAVISRIIHGMKSVTTKQIGYSIWQRSYHDHIIRNQDEYHRIWHYIDKNPVKWIEDRYYQSQL